MPFDHRLLGYPELPRAYRVMMLRPDGRVATNTPVAAGSDLEALTLAETLRTDLAVELWDGLRFIERFESQCA